MRSLRLDQEVEVFIAGIAAAQSLLLSIYSFFERKKDFKNLLLSVFFMAITLRLGKSILWVYLDDSPLWMVNLGFTAHAIAGPVLFLYALHFLFPRKWSQWNWLHFLPAFFILVESDSLTLNGFWFSGGYTALLLQQLIYSGFTLYVLVNYFRLKQTRVPMDQSALFWIIALVVGTTVWQLLYFSNYFLGWTPYLLGPVMYLPFVYFMAFLLFKNPTLLKQPLKTKHQNIRLTQKELDGHAMELENCMTEKQLYMDSNCTLSTVSNAMKLPPYLISYVVNNGIGKSFPDFLNGYRIEEVKRRLTHPDFQNTKIAHIAYDCGFNSLSSFNTAFKKATGTTPSAYLKQVQQVESA
ncbi:helix-turn-helix domain-containing protein [Muricauda sp. CAU 1633]|uniref:helix-turn-helix domain-containing protein n=1 Tax=Allomuricauda sp. CAU 1633 TaxID=2816036 RepID=UPI001A8C9F44|nr:helix-turn-helix domain-containing protein [Muricauda sp. CAU 1633]MBO0323063.1 helix-turn-helix domain-containing protein [Muricauda sp. CAU 1633]